MRQRLKHGSARKRGSEKTCDTVSPVVLAHVCPHTRSVLSENTAFAVARPFSPFFAWKFDRRLAVAAVGHLSLVCSAKQKCNSKLKMRRQVATVDLKDQGCCAWSLRSHQTYVLSLPFLHACELCGNFRRSICNLSWLKSSYSMCSFIDLFMFVFETKLFF